MTSKAFRVRIDRNTSKVGLPVPASGLANFSIRGVWRRFEIEGPDPTVAILNCRARIAKRNSEHRLTQDAAFQLPEGTEFAELRVLNPSDYADLEVTITPAPPPMPGPKVPYDWRYVRPTS